MYNGYLMFDGFEVVNTHRAASYAATAGLSWVEDCNECSSVAAMEQAAYVSPLKDVEKPPWWNANDPDSMDFLGVIGVSISNTDDSTRTLETTPGAGNGGFIGGLRYDMRTIVVRALLIATSDCAIGFGLGWLRGLDTESSCAVSQVGMYECCPHIPADSCSDPECLETCYYNDWRIFYDARITQGPTVLRRREMSSRGWMAEVEFTITCGDPFRYALVPVGLDAQAPLTELAWEPEPVMESAVDLFATSLPFALPPVPDPDPLSITSGAWLRQEAPVPTPSRYAEVVPIVIVDAVDGPAEDVRVTLLRDGAPVTAFRLPRLPDGGTVIVDYRARSVFTESNGIVRRNNAYARSANGRMIRWPKHFLPGEYAVQVDRRAGAPVTTSVAFMGRVNA